MGCYDGRIPIMAAREYGCRAVGIEDNETYYQAARAWVNRERLGDKVKIIHGDLFETDLSDATIIIAYLDLGAINKLGPKLKELEGVRIVTRGSALPDWNPTKVDMITDDMDTILYMYEK